MLSIASNLLSIDSSAGEHSLELANLGSKRSQRLRVLAQDPSTPPSTGPRVCPQAAFVDALGVVRPLQLLRRRLHDLHVISADYRTGAGQRRFAQVFDQRGMPPVYS